MDEQLEYQKRQQLYDTMIVISPNVINAVKRNTNLMLSNQNRYKSISHTFTNPCLTWDIVAVIHEMECSQNFNKYLGNGQSLDKVTTIVSPYSARSDFSISSSIRLPINQQRSA